MLLFGLGSGKNRHSFIARWCHVGFRFWRRIKLAPGLTLNLSKSGASLSVGPQGAKVTVGKKGAQATVGIPGSGLFYTKKITSSGRGKEEKNGDATPPTPLPPPPSMRPEEAAFFEGCAALDSGDRAAALTSFNRSVRTPDGAFFAGYLSLEAGQVDWAEKCLAWAVENGAVLGQQLRGAERVAELHLSITDEVSAALVPGRTAALLGLVEVYQEQSRLDKALEILEQLLELEPDDPVIRLSLMELLSLVRSADSETWKRIVRLGSDLDNESAVHAAILLYKARALKNLGMLDGAHEVLSLALRRRKGRSREFLLATRYERALVADGLNKASRARKDFEKIYAENPTYEDVAHRLGLA